MKPLKNLSLMALTMIAPVAIALSSCKKDYRCDCTEFVNGVEQTNGGSTTGFKSKEVDAEGRCNSYEHTHYTGYNDTIAISWECELTAQ